MNSNRYQLLAEVEHWRSELQSLRGEAGGTGYELITQALILAQNKLIAFEMDIPISVYPENHSVAYH